MARNSGRVNFLTNLKSGTDLLFLQHRCFVNQVIYLFLLCSGSARATTFILSGRRWSLRVTNYVFPSNCEKGKIFLPKQPCKTSNPPAWEVKSKGGIVGSSLAAPYHNHTDLVNKTIERIYGCFDQLLLKSIRMIDINKLTINIPASLLAHQYYPSILQGLSPSFLQSE